MLSAAVELAWPPFVLVTGLLLIGLVAHRDGLFEQAGRSLQGLAGGPVVLLAACLLLVAVVTAVLNLDTAVVFLTPVLVHAARGRGIEEEAFLYGTVYMANASSLYLPGSNLTNLLVLDHQPISGGTFAARMLPIALAATLATALGLFVLFRRRLRAATSQHPQRARWDALGLGLPGALAAAVLTIALRNPAIPVFVVGLALVLVETVHGRLQWREVVRAVGPIVLTSLFLVCIALGVLARSWNGPAQLLDGAGRAAGVCAEVGYFGRFAKPTLLSGFLGLVPSEHTSDLKRRQGSITKAGPPHARRLLVEAAHHYRPSPSSASCSLAASKARTLA